MKDPDLLNEAQKMRVGVSPLPGEELQKLVARSATCRRSCWKESAPLTP